MKSTISFILVLIGQLNASRLLQTISPLPLPCTADAKQCPDGSFVSRDGNNNCEFSKCPACPKNKCVNPATNTCESVVNCFIDPCSIDNGCIAKGQVCISNYCGGCNVICQDVPGPVAGDSCGKQGVDCDAIKAPSYTCSDGTCYGNCGGCAYQEDIDGNLKCEPELVAKEDVCPFDSVGVCPKPVGFGICVERCDSCSNGQLCCSNGCGHVCMDPVQCSGKDQCININGQCDTLIQCNVDPCINGGGCGKGEVCTPNYCGGCNAICTKETCCDPAEIQGPFACFEGCACCPDGTWSGSIGDGKTFSCGGKQCIGADNCGGTICEVDPVGCPEDAKVCPDGTVLSRDPNNNCEFPECPSCKLVGCEPGKTCYGTSKGPICCDPDICVVGSCGGNGLQECESGIECVANPSCPKGLTDCPGICIDIDAEESKVKCIASNQDCDRENGYKCRNDPECIVECAKNKVCLKTNGQCASDADCIDDYECVAIKNGNGFCVDYQ